MKNYLLYTLDGKLGRQVINLNDIYPELYAYAMVPDNADIFATIINSDTTNCLWNGYRTKGLSSFWHKHSLRYTTPPLSYDWDVAQSHYKDDMRKLITPQEAALLDK